MLAEQWDEAETALSRLAAKPEVAEAAAANLEMVKQMKE